MIHKLLKTQANKKNVSPKSPKSYVLFGAKTVWYKFLFITHNSLTISHQYIN